MLLELGARYQGDPARDREDTSTVDRISLIAGARESAVRRIFFVWRGIM